MPGGPSEKRGRQATPVWGSKNVSRNTDLGKRFQPESGARGVKGDSHIGDVVVLRDKEWRW